MNKKVIEVDEKPSICPVCGFEVVGDIWYGLVMPTKECREKLKSGEVILGGCDIWEDSPQWGCSRCGVEFLKIDEKSVILEKENSNFCKRKVFLLELFTTESEKLAYSLEGEIKLTEIGYLIKGEFLDLARYFENIKLLEFRIMFNNMMFMIEILENDENKLDYILNQVIKRFKRVSREKVIGYYPKRKNLWKREKRIQRVESEKIYELVKRYIEGDRDSMFLDFCLGNFGVKGF